MLKLILYYSHILLMLGVQEDTHLLKQDIWFTKRDKIFNSQFKQTCFPRILSVSSKKFTK